MVPLLAFLALHISSSYFGVTKTKNNLNKVKIILQKEKNDLGNYPKVLHAIIRGKPSRQNSIIDYWNNEFYYEQTNNGQGYILFSKGKDGLLNTEDDILPEKS
jgi:hypothetical protein